MDELETQIRIKLRDDFSHYSKKCLKIRPKSAEIIPFEFNSAQKYVHQKVEEQRFRTGKVRALILKGRQQGMSTYVEGRFYWRVTHLKGVRAFILTHDKGATDNLFEMVERYHQNCEPLVRPTTGKNNAKELNFEKLDSGYKIGTAGNKAVGRSSTIQFFHGSECAYWPNAIEHSRGIIQAVPNEKDTEIFLESTANGMGNYFHEQWQLAISGKSDFIPIFVPWFWQQEYNREIPDFFEKTEKEIHLQETYKLTDEQLSWRRYKIIELSAAGTNGEKGFEQEYPCNSIEAFALSGEDTLIPPELVEKARKAINVESIGPLVIGVDPARFGNDVSAIIRRRGRVAYKLEKHHKKDTMELSGIVHQIIKEENPVKVFIDVGGLGAGVVDRLNEMGLKEIIVEVNSGSTPINQKLYINKRSEMWGEMKKFLEQHPVSIPDDDQLHADLCGIKYRFDSLTRMALEPKEQMKKRGLRSPDCADALALTFSYPLEAILNTTSNKESKKAAFIMGKYKEIQKIKNRT
ncbi:MAG: hypothetical protein ACYC6W_11010 [Nitrosotalea sp.]